MGSRWEKLGLDLGCCSGCALALARLWPLPLHPGCPRGARGILGVDDAGRSQRPGAGRGLSSFPERLTSSGHGCGNHGWGQRGHVSALSWPPGVHAAARGGKGALQLGSGGGTAPACLSREVSRQRWTEGVQRSATLRMAGGPDFAFLSPAPELRASGSRVLLSCPVLYGRPWNTVLAWPKEVPLCHFPARHTGPPPRPPLTSSPWTLVTLVCPGLGPQAAPAL